MSSMPKKKLVPKKEREARLIYNSLIFGEAILNDFQFGTQETLNKLNEALDDFLDSVEIYQNGELDITNRPPVFETQ